MRDKYNIDFIFQMTPTDLLAEILKKRINLKYYVKKELANRGQDKNGNWIGFEKAKKHHKIK